LKKAACRARLGCLIPSQSATHSHWKSSVAPLDFAEAMLIFVEWLKFGSFFLDNFLTLLDNTGSTVYKLISLVDGRVLLVFEN
jgi:hypothetical protein